MSELRRDPVMGRWVIIAPTRAAAGTDGAAAGGAPGWAVRFL